MINEPFVARVKDGKYPYIKLFPDEYLGGSLHYGCSLEERGFFIDIMCLAGRNRKERGTLSLEEHIPMTTGMIANALYISESDCERLLKLMEQQERIYRRSEDGVIVITNFDYYQSKYRRSQDKLDVERGMAIHRSREERTRKYVRGNKDIAEDELNKIKEEEEEVININNQIEELKNKGE